MHLEKQFFLFLRISSAVVFLAFAFTIFGCSPIEVVSSSDSTNSDAAEVSVDDESDIDISTPFYSLNLPESWAGEYRYTYAPQENCLSGSKEDGAVMGHTLSLFLEGSNQADFFVTVSRTPAQDHEALHPQGTFCSQDVGQVEEGGYTWTVVVSKAIQPWEKDYDDNKVKSLVNQYASYVIPKFDPADVKDDTIFLGFLGTDSGNEWSHGEGKEVTENRIQSILSAGHWDGTNTGLNKSTVRENDSKYDFDFSSLSFDGSKITYEIPLSAQSVNRSYWSSKNRASTISYELRGWQSWTDAQPYKDKKTLQKYGVALNLVESSDGGSTWSKVEYLLYDAVPYGGADNPVAFVCLGKQGSLAYYTLNDPILRDSADSQVSYASEARSLMNQAITSGDYKQETSGCFDFPPLNASTEIVWALPAKFEDYKFKETNGYYIKVRYPAGSSLKFKGDAYEVFYVYDYGNGHIKLLPTTVSYAGGQYSDLF